MLILEGDFHRNS